MSLPIGAHLGPYEILGPLGAGGMGEVYRARDSRLKRDVAIKVLPDAVAADPEQRARFERETQAVAALSHPNVFAIFDTGSDGGRLYAVTELLEGDTLRARLLEGPIPVRKAIEWTIQIARGLAAAHEKQLVHRDLKPENIFVLTDGRVKILDFGLARSTRAPADAFDAATETVGAITGDGSVVGSVGYMAPEQVRGQPVDARADLFALGAVLYELLTGRRAFRRETPAETMTAILHEDPPDLAVTGVAASPSLARIVRHCLEKNPRERFQTAQDVVFALETESTSTSLSKGTTLDPIASKAAAVTSRRPAMVLLGGVILAGAAMLAWWLFARDDSGATRGDTALSLAVGAATQVTADDGLEIDPALSPDGKLLAYAAGTATRMRIFIRPVSGGRTITLSETGAPLEYRPKWSPDGSQILFLTPDGAFVSSALGGTSKRAASGPLGAATWSPDGTQLLLARGGRLAIKALDGSDERVIAQGGFELHSCDWSRRNDWIACASGNVNGVVPGAAFGNVAPSAVVVVPATGGELTTVAERTASNLSPVWSPDGSQLYFVSNRDGPRDIYELDAPVGRPVALTPRRVTTGLGLVHVALSSRADRMVYVAYAARANVWSMPVPRGPVDSSQGGADDQRQSGGRVDARVSRREVAGVRFDPAPERRDFPHADRGGPVERLTTDPADDFAPDLSPDGALLAYHSWRSGTRDIYVKPLEGGPLQTVTSSPDHESYPIWSPDGQAIAFVTQRGLVNSVVLGSLLIARRDARDQWSPPAQLRADVATNGSWLPDGRSLAFPRGGGIEIIPVDGGSPRVVYVPTAPSDPRVRSVAVSDDGRMLFFKSKDEEGRSAIWSVQATGGRPQLLVRFNDLSRPSDRPDFAAGAGRLFFTLEDRQADLWVAELVRR